jgi:curved DNA-binding protein CbpA
MTSVRNPYRELGVPENATDAFIAARYRSRARELHPDISGGSASKVERFKLVTAAYNVLKTSSSRAQVDEELRRERKLRAAAAAVRQRKTSGVAKQPRVTRTVKVPRVVPSYVPARRPPRAAANPRVPASFTELAVAVARSRPRSETLGWILGGLAADYLRATSR